MRESGCCASRNSVALNRRRVGGCRRRRSGAGSEIAQAVRKTRLSAVFPWRQYHEYGVLMSYGPDSRELVCRGAYFVDKVLKGRQPSDLHLEQVSKVDLVIDLRVAREPGIKVAPELMYRADEVMRW